MRFNRGKSWQEDPKPLAMGCASWTAFLCWDNPGCPPVRVLSSRTRCHLLSQSGLSLRENKVFSPKAAPESGTFHCEPEGAFPCALAPPHSLPKKGPGTQQGKAAPVLSSFCQGLSLCVESRTLAPSTQTGGPTCGDPCQISDLAWDMEDIASWYLWPA